MKKKVLESLLYDFVHSKTGWCDPPPPCCELEDVIITRQDKVNDKIRVSFIYYYNEDWTSDDDMDHVLKGKIIISSSGEVIKGSLKEFSTGKAARKTPYISID
ncbi:MAG: hypothetical protein FK733_19090 [Asgard group archaeon]|nr:hypothetical protein [Asgard group archaeon]